MRKDARERRERLLVAARQMFQEQGYRVPLDIIADRAGVGRGTLYRNFADRRALAFAVLAREVDRLEAFSATLEDDAGLFALIRMLADGVLVNLRLAQAVRAEADGDPFSDLATRRDSALAAPLQDAKVAGLVRQDLQIADVMRAAAMISAPAEYAQERERMIEESLDLLTEGIRPRQPGS